MYSITFTTDFLPVSWTDLSVFALLLLQFSPPFVVIIYRTPFGFRSQ